MPPNFTSTDSRLPAIFRFSGYILNPAEFELSKDGGSIPLEPQVFSLLTYLVQNSGRIIPRNELLDELWGHRFVSESTLATCVKSLRRAVGDDGKNQRVVQTIRRRGYRFVAEVEVIVRETDAAPAAAVSADHPNNLPRERNTLYGRQHDLDTLMSLMHRYRLVSILGIGGTGKTRLSQVLGKRLLQDFPDGVWFVDLIPASNGKAIDNAIANVTRLTLTEGDARSQVVNFFKGQKVLFILDNCEHLKAEVAKAVDDYLNHTEAPSFLLTSRDPINLQDERRYFLEPLRSISDSDTSPASQLFISTAEMSGVDNLPSDRSQIDTICQHLDGLPLAIELAAAQLRYLSIDELAERLQHRFHVMTAGNRAYSDRQSNLAGVLIDTWALLNAEEQELLTQLSAFPSHFRMGDVEELTQMSGRRDLAMTMSRLVELSLLSRGTDSQWRLLETVREFVRSQTDPKFMEKHFKAHAEWCFHKLGNFPDDQMHSLSQASWCLEHYDDLLAAEQYFVQAGRIEDAMFVCCSTGLLIQLDDGARSRQTLEHVRQYLAMEPAPYWLTRLHGTAALCCGPTRAPEQRAMHSAAYLAAAEALGDPVLVADAYIMKSLTTVFSDLDAALELVEEAYRLAESAGNMSIAISALSYHAWHLAVSRQYDKAIQVATQLIEKFKRMTDSGVDNAAYNAISVIVSCTILTSPETATSWLARLNHFPAVSNYWILRLLQACVAAANGQAADCAANCLAVQTSIQRAGKDDFPEVAIVAAVLAYNQQDRELARKWMTAVRVSRRAIQTYHLIVVYKQLLAKLGHPSEFVGSIDEIKEEINTYLLAHKQGSE